MPRICRSPLRVSSGGREGIDPLPVLPPNRRSDLGEGEYNGGMNILYTTQSWEQGAAEIKRFKVKLQKNIKQMESNVEQLISEKELHKILGGILSVGKFIIRNKSTRRMTGFWCCLGLAKSGGHYYGLPYFLLYKFTLESRSGTSTVDVFQTSSQSIRS